MILTTILILFISFLSIIIFILYRALKDAEKESADNKNLIESMRYNNKQLRKTLQKLKLLSEDSKLKIDKIKKSPDNSISNILNNQLSDDKHKT